jgi:BMFP domain-containing protein YqiC
MSSRTESGIDDTSLMCLKDTDKYLRQIGSKALIMIDKNTANEYEEKRKVLLEQRRKQENIEKKIELLEEKFDNILSVLSSISKKIDKNNAD